MFKDISNSGFSESDRLPSMTRIKAQGHQHHLTTPGAAAYLRHTTGMACEARLWLVGRARVTTDETWDGRGGEKVKAEKHRGKEFAMYNCMLSFLSAASSPGRNGNDLKSY
jgi:hypothetical protein